ncbi:MAG: LamG domain-containing protein [Bryobacteraceae bacterium]
MRLATILIVTGAALAADPKASLTFRATFDGGPDAVVAKGDKRIWSAASYKEQASAQPGLSVPGVELDPKAGRKGGALRFKKKNTQALFYKAQGNVAFNPSGWTGTISFWLSLDPETDLEPGYCDPLQVTDKAFNDSAIWVDFTKDDKPRHFRLGVFGELTKWNPQNIAADKNPDFAKRLVVVTKTPFAKGKWTHVVITHEALGSGKGTANLYLDGKLQGSSAIGESFAWDMAKGAIRLGVSYVGLFDDISIYDRALTAKEVASLK